MKPDDKKRDDDRRDDVEEHETQPAEEWGERVETGRDKARGGHAEGEVPGATDPDSDDPRADGDDAEE